MRERTVNEKLAAIRSLLEQKGWSLADLARAAEVNPSTLRLTLYGNQANPRRTYKIERALAAPIWTEPSAFTDLRRASAFLGTDFVLTTFHPLRSLAAAKGVRGTRTITSKGVLLTLVLKHLAEYEAADLGRASDFLGLDFSATAPAPLRAAAIARGVGVPPEPINKSDLLTLILQHIASRNPPLHESQNQN